MSAIMRHLSSVMVKSPLAKGRWASSSGKPMPARIDRAEKLVEKRDAVEETDGPLPLLRLREYLFGRRSAMLQDDVFQLSRSDFVQRSFVGFLEKRLRFWEDRQLSSGERTNEGGRDELRHSDGVTG